MHNQEYITYIADQLSFLNNISIKRMFGGYGIYQDAIFFALIIDNIIYFKVDKTSQTRYEECDSQPFRYDRNGKIVALSYWEVPSEILDNRTQLTSWAQEAIEAAKRSKKQKKSRPT